MMVSFIFFAVFPVSSAGLRASSISTGALSLTGWAVDCLRSIDPPFNQFPSLHVSLTALSCWSLAEAYPRWWPHLLVVQVLVVVSVLTTKQHLLIDVAGGLSLAWLAYVAPRAFAWPIAAAGGLACVGALFALLYAQAS